MQAHHGRFPPYESVVLRIFAPSIMIRNYSLLCVIPFVQPELRDASGIALDAMMFIGDAIFPGGNDYPAKELGLDTVRVRDPQETLSVIDAIVACQK